MAYRWTAEPEGIDLPDLDRQFDDQAEAEAWFGENWSELADAGATAVTLWEADRVVYGPMSLAEA
ncbi:hypothetical protein [Enemella sp. A6]|uniref:hypothetical protein n=1 Tax=Enemella sp. A6 TaxID=3440152 RepID=UPI003EB96D75